VGLRGLEPRTSTLSVLRSNHLSYKPIFTCNISTLITYQIYLI
jgi:hypothetical protein